MEKAKAAVSEFMHKAGHNDTTVHEKVAPAVVHETIKKHQHEDVITAVDKEIHHDHYHTSIQPVKDKEILPEQHQTRVLPVEQREEYHGNQAAIQARLKEEAAQFTNKRVEAGTTTSSSAAPVIAGEHHHHHVHEVIQPVVQKETIQPSVVHTTVPIHEVHHNEPLHHGASQLPAMSMSEFKAQGGSLTGREERYDGFEGEPKYMANATTGTTGGVAGVGHHGHTTAGPHSSDLGNKMDPRVDSDRDGSIGRSRLDPGSSLDPRVNSSTSSHHGTGTASHKKPSIIDRLNPLKDTDGDGKKGFME